MEKFKAGDWVKDTRSGIKRPVVQLQPNCIALINPEEYGKQYIKWEPEPGEWCWFYDKENLWNKTNTVIARFSHMYQKYYATSHLIDNGYFKYCEPFIGELPSNLKEL